MHLKLNWVNSKTGLNRWTVILNQTQMMRMIFQTTFLFQTRNYWITCNNLREYVNLYNRIISLFQFINRCSDACLGIKYDFIEEFSPISCKLIKNEINNNEEYSDQDFLSSMYEEINKKHEIIIDAGDKLNQIVLDLTLFENPDAWTAQLRQIIDSQLYQCKIVVVFDQISCLGRHTVQGLEKRAWFSL